VNSNCTILRYLSGNSLDFLQVQPNLCYISADGSNYNVELTPSLTTIQNNFALPSSTVPATSTDTGVTGQLAWDVNYFYICTATNTWKRTALSSW
jgi:hypothetical protein